MPLSTLFSNQILVEQMRWRYATKKFAPTKKISADDWQALEEVLVLTPSSYGLQPWKFFVVDDSSIRERLVAASWGQRQVADASHLVVMAIRRNLDMTDVDRHLDRTAEVQQIPRESLNGLRTMIAKTFANPPEVFDVNDWAAQQVYIALGNFMTAAALLGIDTCPMEGFQPQVFDEVLGLTAKGYASCVLCPAGYRAEDDRQALRAKVRFKLEDVIEHI